MPYTVEVTIADPPSPHGKATTRMYQLPDPYDTVAGAREAAEHHIADLGLTSEAVVYDVFDREGFTVASNAEAIPEPG